METPRRHPRANALSRTERLDPRGAVGGAALAFLGLVLVVVLVLVRLSGGN